MMEKTTPLVIPDKLTLPFWRACRAGELRIQKCANCAQYRFYPRTLCPNCMSEDYEWALVSGRGTLHSFSIVYRAPSDHFAKDVPYPVVLIDLDDVGVRMMSRLVDCALGDIRIGLPVEVTFHPEGLDLALPFFRPRAKA